MSETPPSEYLAECFWPGVGEAELRALDERARASAAAVSAQGRPVHYLGSLLVREDEVVFCQFEGTAETVREAAERAQIPFERIVATTHSPWPLSRNGGGAP
jgi:hypothetical protein